MKEREDHLKNLFLEAQKNNQDAYRALLQDISQLLRPYLTKLMSPKVRSRERVEDLVQDVLISIHRKRDLYSVERPFIPWIYAIAKYRLIDSLRAEARCPELVEWIENLDTREYIHATNDLMGDGSMELLAALTDRQKEILTMAKVDEIPLKEIATHFHMSVPAVKVTIHRILKSLRTSV